MIVIQCDVLGRRTFMVQNVLPVLGTIGKYYCIYELMIGPTVLIYNFIMIEEKIRDTDY